MAYKYSPSKAKRAEFASKVKEVEEYCKLNNIQVSRSGDSFYFEVNGKKCRISNHTVETSDNGALESFFRTGVMRESYHQQNYDIDILASKTRLIEIHQALLAGYQLDGRGKIKKEA